MSNHILCRGKIIKMTPKNNNENAHETILLDDISCEEKQLFKVIFLEASIVRITQIEKEF